MRTRMNYYTDPENRGKFQFKFVSPKIQLVKTKEYGHKLNQKENGNKKYSKKIKKLNEFFAMARFCNYYMFM